MTYTYERAAHAQTQSTRAAEATGNMCNMCKRDVTPLADRNVELPPAHKSIERFKRKHNIVTDPNDEEKQKEVAYQPDLLAVSTQYTKVAYDVVKQRVSKLQENKIYSFVTRFTQPLHILMATVLSIAWLSQSDCFASLKGWRALYVLSVATHLGSQVWMTLVSGIALYFSLPRHEFGRVQTVLFPVYFAFNACVSALASLAYFRCQTLTNFQGNSWVQLALLLCQFTVEAYVRLSLVKPMLRAKRVKTQMEESAGGGQEVGRLVLGELAHCPRYMRELKVFRAYHSCIAMGTIITLGCSLYSVMVIVETMC